MAETTVTTTADVLKMPGAMSKEVLQKVEQIEIDPDGRYILLASGTTAEGVQELKDELRAWMERDEKFSFSLKTPGVEFCIERVGGCRDGRNDNNHDG